MKKLSLFKCTKQPKNIRNLWLYSFRLILWINSRSTYHLTTTQLPTRKVNSLSGKVRTVLNWRKNPSKQRGIMNMNLLIKNSKN